MRYIYSIILSPCAASIDNLWVTLDNPMVPPENEADITEGYLSSISTVTPLPNSADAIVALENLEKEITELMIQHPSGTTIDNLLDSDPPAAQELKNKYFDAMSLFWETVGSFATMPAAPAKGEKGPYSWEKHLTVRSGYTRLTIKNQNCEYKAYWEGSTVRAIVMLPESMLPPAPPCMSEKEDLEKSVHSYHFPIFSSTGTLVPGHDDWSSMDDLEVEIRCYLHTPYIPIPGVKMSLTKYSGKKKSLPKNFRISPALLFGGIRYSYLEGIRLCVKTESVLRHMYKDFMKAISMVPDRMRSTEMFYKTKLPTHIQILDIYGIPFDLGPTLCSANLCTKIRTIKNHSVYTEYVFAVAQMDFSGLTLRMTHRWVFDGNPTDTNARVKTIYHKLYNPRITARDWIALTEFLLDVPKVFGEERDHVTHRHDPIRNVHVCLDDGVEVGEVAGHDPEPQCQRLARIARMPHSELDKIIEHNRRIQAAIRK